MPALYSLAVHPALHAAAAGLREGEPIFAFLNDAYDVAPPARIAAVQAGLQEALWAHARIQLNTGKKRVWSAPLGSIVQQELRRKRGLHDELLKHLHGLRVRLLLLWVTDEFARGHEANVHHHAAVPRPRFA